MICNCTLDLQTEILTITEEKVCDFFQQTLLFNDGQRQRDPNTDFGKIKKKMQTSELLWKSDA